MVNKKEMKMCCRCRSHYDWAASLLFTASGWAQRQVRIDSWEELEQVCPELHAENKDHPSLQKPLLTSEKKRSLSTHSWQCWILRGQWMTSKTQQGEQEVLQMYHTNCVESSWLIWEVNPPKQVAEPCWPFSFQYIQPRLMLSKLNSLRLRGP